MGNYIKLSNILPINNVRDYKTHFAIWNGQHHPLDVFARDRNDWHGWNAYKGKRDNFNRRYIFSLINVYSETNIWLFGGIYEVLGIENEEYKVLLNSLGAEYIGRLKIHFKLTGRNRRIYLESCYADLNVSEILKEPYSGQVFPGYENIDLSFEQLEIIVKNDRPDWRGALQNIKGVYLIVDKKNGKKYVGSAYGEHGIWTRWRCYIETGHGWNDELTQLIDEKGLEYAQSNFKLTLLEFRSAKTDNDTIISRETFWKEALITRGNFGYNKN